MSDWLQKLRGRRLFLAEKGKKAEEFSLFTPDGTAIPPKRIAARRASRRKTAGQRGRLSLLFQ